MSSSTVILSNATQTIVEPGGAMGAPAPTSGTNTYVRDSVTVIGIPGFRQPDGTVLPAGGLVGANPGDEFGPGESLGFEFGFGPGVVGEFTGYEFSLRGFFGPEQGNKEVTEYITVFEDADGVTDTREFAANKSDGSFESPLNTLASPASELQLGFQTGFFEGSDFISGAFKVTGGTDRVDVVTLGPAAKVLDYSDAAIHEITLQFRVMDMVAAKANQDNGTDAATDDTDGVTVLVSRDAGATFTDYQDSDTTDASHPAAFAMGVKGDTLSSLTPGADKLGPAGAQEVDGKEAIKFDFQQLTDFVEIDLGAFFGEERGSWNRGIEEIAYESLVAEVLLDDGSVIRQQITSINDDGTFGLEIVNSGVTPTSTIGDGDETIMVDGRIDAVTLYAGRLADDGVTILSGHYVDKNGDAWTDTVGADDGLANFARGGRGLDGSDFAVEKVAYWVDGEATFTAIDLAGGLMG